VRRHARLGGRNVPGLPRFRPPAESDASLSSAGPRAGAQSLWHAHRAPPVAEIAGDMTASVVLPS
jgi:hypothetical protein